MSGLSELSADDAKRLDDAIINYGALTGRGINPADLLTDASLAQDVTTLMAEIYRRDMRAKMLGWGSEG